MEIMRETDPDAVGRRRQGRLQRRIYSSKVLVYRVVICWCVYYCVFTYNIHMQGPNFCWHLDGYDKLSPFGFHIHGCIDGCVHIVIDNVYCVHMVFFTTDIPGS